MTVKKDLFFDNNEHIAMPTPIPFMDLQRVYQRYRDEVDEALLRVARSGWYIGGPEVTQFEEVYAQATGAEYCVGVASGLDALKLSLLALDIGAGDEVIVPVHTYIATYLAIMDVGAVPIPVACNDDFLIAPDAIEAAITPRTKAILPVHLYGMPCEMTAIQAIAKTHHLKVNQVIIDGKMFCQKRKFRL